MCTARWVQWWQKGDASFEGRSCRSRSLLLRTVQGRSASHRAVYVRSSNIGNIEGLMHSSGVQHRILGSKSESIHFCLPSIQGEKCLMLSEACLVFPPGQWRAGARQSARSGHAQYAPTPRRRVACSAARCATRPGLALCPLPATAVDCNSRTGSGSEHWGSHLSLEAALVSVDVGHD